MKYKKFHEYHQMVLKTNSNVIHIFADQNDMGSSWQCSSSSSRVSLFLFIM